MIDSLDLESLWTPQVDGIEVGMRVSVTAVTNKRGGQRLIDGNVIYVSSRGWATVRLDLGYQESFWIDALQPI